MLDCRRTLAAVVLAVSVSAVAPSFASATTVMTLDGSVNVLGGTTATDLDIGIPTPGTIRVTDASIDDNLTAGAGCIETVDETVECPSTPITYFYGGSAGDSVDVQPSVATRVELYGGGGDDVLLAGAGNDRLGGGLGDDDLDGRDGSDLVDNGYNNSAQPVAADGADTYRDTGATGVDSLNFGGQTERVAILLDGSPNDGAPGEGDNVLAGFEKLRGTAFNDTISGGDAAETINGSGGDDSISGGGGADTLEGNGGNDIVNAASGDVDAAVLCDSPSDNPATVGTADVAYVDAGDPAPQGCETINGPVPGPGPDPGPGTTTGTTPTTTTNTPTGFVLGAPVKSEVVSRMPRVTGKPFASARNTVLGAIGTADVDLVFRKGCASSSDLEIVKQLPITGASLPNDLRSPVKVTLTACLAEKDFLRDCDLKDLRTDLRDLPKGAMDAEVGLRLAKTVNKCKVDYDIKLQKAADEAKIVLAAQQAEAKRTAEGKKVAEDKAKRKAELKVGLSCPIPGDLRIAVADGYTPNRRALGPRVSGPGGWTLPAGFQSFVEITVIDRALHFSEATVYIDADETSYLKTPPKKTTGGRVQIALDNFKGAGKVRLCVVQETGGDEVLTGAVELTVVPRPSNGTVWETTSGRRLKITADGAVLAKARSARTVAKAAGLGEIWDAIVRAFSGASRSIANAIAGTSEEKRQRLVDAYEGPKYGAAQISLTGKLASDPAAAVVGNGPCVAVGGDGSLRGLTCPQLQTIAGTATIATRLGGVGLVAAGGGNVVTAAKSNLVGNDGSTLVGLDGSTLVGNDGASLVGPDGASLVGPDGGTLVGLDGASVAAKPDGTPLVAAGGGNAISVAPAQLVAAGAGNLVGQDGSTLVAAGGLN